MTDIFVSDLFGYNIDNETPFVIINTSESYKLLKKIAKNKTSSIWEYNKKKFDDILKARNVDPNKFVSLGHVLYKPKLGPKTFILCNKSICTPPTDNEEIMAYENGKIVRPYAKINDKNFYSLGLFYTNGNKLNTDYIGVIDDKYLLNVQLPTESSSSNEATDGLEQNEFSLLSATKLGIKTINKNKLLNNDMKTMRLVNSSNKYITDIDNESTKSYAKLKLKQRSLKQNFSYNAQGELISNGKCLTYENDNENAYFSSCDPNNKKQKWTIANNKISPAEDFSKCLKSDDDDISIQKCDKSIDQLWETEDADLATSSDYTWDKYQGKTVVLVESDNPWFINEDVTYPVKIKNINYIPTDDVGYRFNADFKSTRVLDGKKPHLGFGHSIADRDGISCSKVKQIEKFDGKASEDNQIIVIIMLIIIVLIIYKLYAK